MKLILATLVLATLGTLPHPTRAEEPTPPPHSLQVGADTSLRSVLRDLAQTFADGEGNPDVQLNIAPSGIIRRHVENNEGALDIVVAAAPGEIEVLAKQGKIRTDTARTLAENELVVVTAWPGKTWGRPWVSLARLDWNRIAVASVENAMSGVGALALFKNATIYAAVEEKLIHETDSERVLDALRRARVDAAVIYRSDVGILKPRDSFEVFEVGDIPYPPIVYSAAVLSSCKNVEGAKVFIAHLAKTENQEVWARHGFQPTEITDAHAAQAEPKPGEHAPAESSPEPQK